VLETKGQDSGQAKAKRNALTEWIAAVNTLVGVGGLTDYGEWCSDISFNVADVDGIIARYL
jgi:type III restriction enzyme